MKKITGILLSLVMMITMAFSAGMPSHAASTGVEGFVTRLYENILQRTPDPSGLESWVDVLTSGKESGAKVAQGFVDSNEFKSRNLSNTEYITILYQTFLGREADASGLASWEGVLDGGLSRNHVLRGFAESDEFTKICADYGIIRGNITLTEARDQDEGITKFILRCYNLCLGRSADVDGLNAWCGQLLSGANTPKQVAYGFVFSNEFQARNLSNEDYVKTLYRVFMDREADASGLASWVNVLNSGQSREHVFNGFADAPEFTELYNKILSGQYSGSSGTTSGNTGGTTSESEVPESQEPETEAPHTHTWEAQTKVVHHEAETKQVWVVDKEAYDEPVYEGHVICNGCGKDFGPDGSYSEDEFMIHLLTCDPGSYHVKSVKVGTIHHEAEGHYETQVVTPAWDETVVTGYVCSGCGAAK